MSTIKLSPETVSKLEKIYEINQSIKIVQDSGVLRSVSESKTVAMETPIAEKMPRTVCIYDLREFLSILKIIKDPVINLDNPKYMVIQSADGSQQIRYMDAAANIVNSSYMDKMPVIPVFDVEVMVAEDLMKAVMGAATNLGLEFVGFTSDGTNMYLKAFDLNNGDNNETNVFSVNMGPNTHVFNMFYKTASWKVLEGACMFMISKSKVSCVESGDLTFLMTLDAKSSFN